MTTIQGTQGGVQGVQGIQGVVQRLTFSTDTVKRLTADDFDLGSREMISLKYDDCILVLFYGENTESYQMANIWAMAAQQVAGPIFAAVNLMTERKVAEAFTRLKSDGSNPLHPFALRQYPYILVYRKRWPVAVYNGPREVLTIIDYALIKACEANYYEPIQLGGSMQADNRLQMAPYAEYVNSPGQPDILRKSSVEFTPENTIRGFNPSIGLTPITTNSTTTTTTPTPTPASTPNPLNQGSSTLPINSNTTPTSGVTEGRATIPPPRPVQQVPTPAVTNTTRTPAPVIRPTITPVATPSRNTGTTGQ